MTTTFQPPGFIEIESLSSHLSGTELIAASGDFPASIPLAVIALTIFRDEDITNSDLMLAGIQRMNQTWSDKSTFVPIFTTNYCDSACAMCGMRKGNAQLIRKFSGKRIIEDQLVILRDYEHVRGVGFLTGEYQGEYVRKANAFLIGWAIRRALDMGFETVYFNIGSMEPSEIEILGEWLETSEPITMCVFQETYNFNAYSHWMGNKSISVPKSDFQRRISSFDHWLDAGFKRVNPGFLVGLHADPGEDLVNLVSHAEYLLARGADVRISVPRLRPALGGKSSRRISDEEYLRLIATLAYVVPQCRIVLTTRESQEFQDQALPIIGVFSPGSPDVAPYQRYGEAPNDPHSSQFSIPDHRRPRDILARLESIGYKVQHFYDK